MEAGTNLISEIMNTVKQTDVFNNLMMTDPYISENDQWCERVIEQVRQYEVPDEILNELDEAITAYASSYIDTAILYGAHLSQVIRAISTNPVELARCLAAERE